MDLMIIKLCVCACSLYCKFYRHIIIACQPPSNPEISHKHLGSSFEFLCNPSSTCVGKIYNFFHYNRTTQKYDLVFQGSQKYRKNALLSFDVHTNSAVFTINNTTKNCKTIYCLIRNNVHSTHDIRELPIIGKCQVT